MAKSKQVQYYQIAIKNKALEKARLERIKDGSFTIDDIKADTYNNKYMSLCLNKGIKIIPVLEGSLTRLYIQNKDGSEDADNKLFNQVKKPLEITKRINQLYEYYYLKLYGNNNR